MIQAAEMQPRVAQLFAESRQGIIDQPDSPEAWAKLGAVCEVHLLLSDAEACYRHAHELAPNDFRWTYFLAIVVDSIGQQDQEPIDLYHEASHHRPDYAPLWFRLGEALARRGRLESALDAYGKALELDDTMAIAQYGYGQVELKLANAKSAVLHLERAASLSPTDGPTLAALAQAYMRLGDRGRALKASDASRQLVSVLVLTDPARGQVGAMGVSSRVCYRRAVQYLKSGRNTEALQYLEVLEQVKSGDPKVQVWSAFAHLRLGNREMSRRHLAHALRLKQDLEKVDRTFAPLPKARQRLTEMVFEFLREYLHRVTQQRDIAELRRAIAEFEAASAQVSPNSRAFLTWGNALLRIGDLAEAKNRYLDALRLEPNNVDALFDLGLVAEKQGNVDEAIAYYDRAAQIAPDQDLKNRLERLRSKSESP